MTENNIRSVIFKNNKTIYEYFIRKCNGLSYWNLENRKNKMTKTNEDIRCLKV